jgi:hypothetical protein
MPGTQRPRIAKLHQVRITKEKNMALVEFLDPALTATYLTIGPEVSRMSDWEILDFFNEIVLAQERLTASNDDAAVEIPEGRPQVRYSAQCDQWVPCGDVLRCRVDNDGNEAVIEIDGRQFSMAEFGRMLSTYSGQGMRICFIPGAEVNGEPQIEVREPDDEPDY